MYGVLAHRRSLNRHIDVAEDHANNMRLYEATGVGTLLLTDAKHILSDLFAIGEEVVRTRTRTTSSRRSASTSRTTTSVDGSLALASSGRSESTRTRSEWSNSLTFSPASWHDTSGVATTGTMHSHCGVSPPLRGTREPCIRIDSRKEPSARSNERGALSMACERRSVSLVVPLYRDAHTLPLLFDRLAGVLPGVSASKQSLFLSTTGATTEQPNVP